MENPNLFHAPARMSVHAALEAHPGRDLIWAACLEMAPSMAQMARRHVALACTLGRAAHVLDVALTYLVSDAHV